MTVLSILYRTTSVSASIHLCNALTMAVRLSDKETELNSMSQLVHTGMIGVTTVERECH